MEKVIVQLASSFYTTSPFATCIINEEHDNSEGLIFHEFVQELGVFLGVDIIYEDQGNNTWVIADTSHLQIIVEKDETGMDTFEFIPKSIVGTQLIQNMTTEFLSKQKEYFHFL
ncbi:hypothetical protein [Bacillus alkalicellulosilyticus]|uniref:hypothetical protein n=1 Tax=Alkalihalobacterium alkalicellulosilyticum TaxID=1912214 RepID=UPI001116BD0A|nr:hypothetical protein [Bacillus alkalicellulosilyticus]